MWPQNTPKILGKWLHEFTVNWWCIETRNKKTLWICYIYQHILSVIHYIIYWTVCFQFTHFPSLVMIDGIYTFSYCRHQIGNTNYFPLFRVRSWNNDKRSMFLYFLTTLLIEQITSEPDAPFWCHFNCMLQNANLMLTERDCSWRYSNLLFYVDKITSSATSRGE